MAVVAALGVIVSVTAGALELKDRLFPPPRPVEATVTPTPAVEVDVAWRQALSDHPELGSGSFTASQLATDGVIFTVKLKVKGERGETGHLEWRLISDGAELNVPAWVPRAVPISSRSDDHDVAQMVWVPLVRGVEEFHAEFTYVDSASTAHDTEPGPQVSLG